MLEIIKKMS